MRLMPLGKLTHAWTAVEASLPRDAGWRLMGVVLGPREADPVIRSESWVAWAKNPNGGREEAQGDSPESALLNLAEKLRLLRGDANG